MSAPLKVIPHPLHDIVPQTFDEDEERRKDHPENLTHEILEGLRWLDANGYSKQVDDIWFEFYYGAK